MENKIEAANPPTVQQAAGDRRPVSGSGVHAVQSLRAHMRARETMLRKECDRLDAEGAPLDALAKKMIADELDRYCQMLNRLEYDYSQNSD